MSINVEDVLYKYETEKLDKILFQSLKGLNYFNHKILVYNPNSCNPLQKFWIKIDRCKILNINNNVLTLVFACTDKENQLVAFVHRITSKIEEYCKLNINTDVKITSKLNNEEYSVPTLDAYISDTTTIFNNFGQKTNYDILKNLDTISVFIELEYVVVNSNFGSITWRVIQMKIINDLNPEISFFDKHEPYHVPSPYVIPPPPPPPPMPTLLAKVMPTPLASVISTMQPPVPTQTSFIPNKADLLGALSKLRTVKKEDDCIESKITIDPIIPQLKKAIADFQIQKPNAEYKSPRSTYLENQNKLTEFNIDELNKDPDIEQIIKMHKIIKKLKKINKKKQKMVHKLARDFY